MVFLKFDNFSNYRGERGHEKDEIHRHHPKKVRTEGYLPLCHLPLLLLLCQNRGSSLTQPCVTHLESPTGMPSCRPLSWNCSPFLRRESPEQALNLRIQSTHMKNGACELWC